MRYLRAALFALLATAIASTVHAQAYRVGPGIQMKPRGAAPSDDAGNGTLWISSTGNVLKYTDPSNSTITIGAAAGSTYATVENEGSSLTQRTVINFTGAGVDCADSGGKTVCNIAGGGTLNSIYAGGVSTSSSVIELDSTRGAVTIRDNASTIGTMFEGTNVTGGPSITYFRFGANNSHVLRSGMADGGSAIGTLIDTTSTWGNASARLFVVKNNNTERFAVMASGDLNTSSSGMWWDEANKRLHIGSPSSPTGRFHIAGPNGSAAQMRIDNSGGGTSMMCGSADSPAVGFCGSLSSHPFVLRYANSNTVAMESASFYSYGDLAVDLGTSTNRWKSVAADVHYSRMDTSVSATATPAFSSTGGEVKRFTLTTNITSWTLASGQPGQILTLELIQDATGSRTLAGTPANVLFAGGTPTLTTTASKRDVFTFRYDSTDSKWVEIGRAMNL